MEQGSEKYRQYIPCRKKDTHMYMHRHVYIYVYMYITISKNVHKKMVSEM